MASRGYQHCANCIGTLSFPTGSACVRSGGEDEDATSANKTGISSSAVHRTNLLDRETKTDSPRNEPTACQPTFTENVQAGAQKPNRVKVE